MKICLFSASLEQGGAERVISILANEFVKLGHSVSVITLVDRPIFFKLDSRIEVSCLNFENKNPVNKLINQLVAIKKLKRKLKNKNPDVLLSFMVKYNIIAILAALKLNIKVFISDRSNPLKKLPIIQSCLRKKLYPKVSGIIAQTKLAEKIMIQTIGNESKVRVIFNPIKPFKKQNLPKEKIIISVGRLVKLKGHEYLIRAFAKNKHKGWRLVILGEGPEFENLKRLASDLDIQDLISLPGAVKNVSEWLEKSEIFAFTSSSEGFPNALAEAMISGLPCISFDCNAGPRDLISEDNGILIPEGDEKLLSDNIGLLMKDDELRNRLGQKANSISNRLNDKVIAKEYLNFFNSND